MFIKQSLFYCEILYNSLGVDKNFHEDFYFIFYFAEKGFDHFQSKVKENKLYGEYIDLNDIFKKWIDSISYDVSFKKISIGSGITALNMRGMIGKKIIVSANSSEKKIFDSFLESKLNQLKEMIGENNFFSLMISSEEFNKVVEESEKKNLINERNDYILECFDKIRLTNKLEIDLSCNNKIEYKNKI